MQLILHEIVCSLSSALDFVGIDEIYHGKRVALIAAATAEQLGWDESRQLDMLYAGMLHDCGVSTTTEHTKLVRELEWSGSAAHCKRGFDYLRDCPFLDKYASWILYHHTDWQHLECINELDEQDKLCANLLFLSDRIDFLQVSWVGFDGKNDILCQKDRIIEEINQYKGRLFSPKLLSVFNEVAATEAFWLKMENYYVNQSIRHYSAISPLVKLEFDQIRQITQLFSRIIDAKSTFTEEHSDRVAKLARFLAEQYDFSSDELDQIEIAGLLHDIGKLRVPDQILEKRGPLTAVERARIARHSFDTYQLLQSIFPGTKIADWAGSHHESLTGEGYPFRKKSSELDLGARIISVADCFQALVQKRPYRSSLSIKEVLSIINQMVDNGKLDGNVVNVLKRCREQCYQLAKQ